MPDYKLTYFDFHGGRAEPIRIALHAAGIPFEDVRWSFQDFGEKRGDLRFNAIPTLEIDGKVITQSNAIGRYIGKMAGLYPEDPLQALYCDEAMGAAEDINHYVVQTFGLKGDDLKEAREILMNGRLTVFVKGFAELLARGGGKYLADNRLTIADLKLLTQIKNFRAGNVDHIPAGFIDSLAPEFAAYQERIDSDPIVIAYYKFVA